jgi:hypothetical protein
MSTLKEIAFIVTPFVVTCAIAYLLGSFVSASFDPRDWSWIARMLSAVWGVSFGFMLLIRLTQGKKYATTIQG